MTKINQMPYEVKQKVEAQISELQDYKNLESLFEQAYDLNLEDAEMYPSLSARHEVVEDDGFIHVYRGYVRFVEYLGQERKILKRDIKAVEKEVDSFLNNHSEGIFKSLNEQAWLVINKVQDSAKAIMAQAKHVEDLEQRVRDAEQCVRDAQKELKMLIDEAVHGEKKFEDLDRGELMNALFAEFEVKGDKAQRAFNKAWDLGHAYGNEEVRNEFIDLVDLIK